MQKIGDFSATQKKWPWVLGRRLLESMRVRGDFSQPHAESPSHFPLTVRLPGIIGQRHRTLGHRGRFWAQFWHPQQIGKPLLAENQRNHHTTARYQNIRHCAPRRVGRNCPGERESGCFGARKSAQFRGKFSGFIDFPTISSNIPPSLGQSKAIQNFNIENFCLFISSSSFLFQLCYLFLLSLSFFFFYSCVTYHMKSLAQASLQQQHHHLTREVSRISWIL